MPTKKKDDDVTKDVVKFAYGLISEGMNYKKILNIDTKYQQSLRYQMGDQESTRKNKKNKVWNKYAEVFENRVAHVVGQRPRWRFKPQAGDDVISADVANQIIGDVFWERDDMEDKSEDALWEMSHAGSVHIKTNVTDNGWPTFLVCDAPSILTDKTKSLKTARYIIHLMYMGIPEIKELYNKDVKPEAELENIDNVGTFNNPQISFESSGDDTMPSKVWASTGFGENFDKTKWMQGLIGRALVAEIWLEDSTIEKVPFKDGEVEEEHELLANGEIPPVDIDENHPMHILSHMAYAERLDPEVDSAQIANTLKHVQIHKQYPQEEKRRKYPKGRVLTVCQNKLMADVPNPRPMHWRKVWIKADYGKVPGRYWGKSLGNDLIDIQDAINHRKNSITQNINLLNNGIIKITRTAAQSLKSKLTKFSNLIGRVVEVNHKDDFGVDFGEPLPPQVFQDLYHDENFMDENVGKNDVQSGKLPGSDTSGTAVGLLLQEGSKRINLAVKHWAFALQQMARNALEIMQVSVDKNELLQILDKEKGYYQDIEWKDLRGGFSVNDIRIDVDAFVTSREQKRNEALQLYNSPNPVVDRKYVLDKIDDPDKYETMQRMDEIDMLNQYVSFLQENLDATNKKLNTAENRAQSAEGKGNVGGKKTSK